MVIIKLYICSTIMARLNLEENAVDHTPKIGRGDLEIGIEERKKSLEIENQGRIVEEVKVVIEKTAKVNYENLRVMILRTVDVKI